MPYRCLEGGDGGSEGGVEAVTLVALLAGVNLGVSIVLFRTVLDLKADLQARQRLLRNIWEPQRKETQS